MTVDPAVAARQLEAIADRIACLMQSECASLSVSAAGRDEVSRQVAGALNRMAEEFVRSVDRGVDEARLLATALHSSIDGQQRS